MVHDFNRLSGDTPTAICGQLDMFVHPELISAGRLACPTSLPLTPRSRLNGTPLLSETNSQRRDLTVLANVTCIRRQLLFLTEPRNNQQGPS